MVKKYEIRGIDGNFIQFSETEEGNALLITISEINAEKQRMIQANILVDYDQWNDIQCLRYDLKLNLRKEVHEEDE